MPAILLVGDDEFAARQASDVQYLNLAGSV